MDATEPRRLLRVLIADDNPLIRQSLAVLIDGEPFMKVVTQASGADEAVALAEQEHPDVAVLDVQMPGGGPVAVRGIRRLSPGTKMIAFTADSGGTALREMLASGIVGYLSKTAPIEKVLEMIRWVGQAETSLAGIEVRAGDEPPSGPVPRLRLLVADDEPDVVDALVAMFAEDGVVEVVGAACDVPSAIRMAVTHAPDVALVDVTMGGESGPLIAEALSARLPGLSIVAVHMSSDLSLFRQSIRSGAGADCVVIRVATREWVRPAVLRAFGKGQASPAPNAPISEELVFRAGESGEREGLARVQRIRRMLDGGLELAYQPAFNLATGTIAEVEGLARFGAHAQRSPEIWFREAYAAGLGEALELAAVAAGLQALGGLRSPVGLALNLSAAVAASPTLPSLLSVIPRADRSRICLQVPVSDQIDDYTAFNQAVGKLRSDGVRLELDNVGFDVHPDHVRRLRPDQLNAGIDVCRVSAGDTQRLDALSRIVDLAHEIGVMVVAEGIESREQMDLLRERGIGFGQGNYLAEPGPLPLAAIR